MKKRLPKKTVFLLFAFSFSHQECIKMLQDGVRYMAKFKERIVKVLQSKTMKNG